MRRKLPFSARLQIQRVPDIIVQAGEEATVLLEAFTIKLDPRERGDMVAGKPFRVFCRVEYTDFMEEVWVLMTAWCWDRPDGVGDYALFRDGSAPRHYNGRKKIYP